MLVLKGHQRFIESNNAIVGNKKGNLHLKVQLLCSRLVGGGKKRKELSTANIFSKAITNRRIERNNVDKLFQSP